MIPMFNFVEVVEANQLTFPTKKKTRHHVDVKTNGGGKFGRTAATGLCLSGCLPGILLVLFIWLGELQGILRNRTERAHGGPFRHAGQVSEAEIDPIHCLQKNRFGFLLVTVML